MKAFALASLLPFLAAAGPVKRDQQVPPFTVTAVRSGSDIQYLSLEARGGKFWLGGDPGTYCPLTSGSCPPSTETVISGVNALVSIILAIWFHIYRYGILIKCQIYRMLKSLAAS